MYFKDVQKGLFRYRGLVYTKISDTEAVLITNGQVKTFEAEDIVEPW